MSSLTGLQQDRIIEPRLFLNIDMKPDNEDCCRFCANFKNKNDLLNLELYSDVFAEYMEMLRFLKIDYVDFSSHNKLSRNICKHCSRSFENAYFFFKQVERAQETLLSYYDNDSTLNLVKETVNYSRNCTVTSATANVTNELVSEHNQFVQCNEIIEDNIHIKEETPEPEVTTHLSQSSKVETDFPLNLIDSLVKANFEDNNISIKKENITKTPSPPVSPKPQSDLGIYKANSPVTHEETTVPITNTVPEPQTRIELKQCECDTAKQTKDISEKESKEKSENINIFTSPVLRFLLEPEADESWDSYEWLCFHCNVKCDTMNDLRTHSKDAHAKCYGFKCVDCRDDFNTFNCFIEHVRRHREYLRFFCEYCNQEFDSPSLCASHTLTHWSGSQRACEHCGELLPDQEALERHRRAYKKKAIARHSRRKGIVLVPGFVDAYGDESKSWLDYDWTCRDCGARLPDVASLRLHSQKVHKKCFTVKCVDCLLVRRCFKSFVTHVRRHRPVFSKFCEYCNVYCRDINTYNNHVRTHDTPVPPCDGCGQIFPTRAELREHIITYNACTKSATLTKDDLKCETCQKQCNTIHTLKSHMETHSDNRERQYTCDICGASFYSYSTFRGHTRLHEGKNIECTVCKATFSSNIYLNRHMRTHSEVKPFICDLCGRTFRDKHQIRSHLLSHTDTKPFRCLVCDKRFRCKHNLKVHMPQHTGFKNFSCEFCDVKFFNWSNCNKHMIRRHGVTLARTKRTPTGKVTIADRRVSTWVETSTKSDDASE